MLWKGTWGPGAPRSGTYSYVFSNWADGYWRTLQLGARAGEQYDLYAYIRGELDADTTQGRFLIRAKFMDSNGASLGYSDITAMYPGAISSWTRVGGRVTAPANSVSMQVQYLLYQSSGWVNIDDVEVTIVAPNAATEITKYYYFGGQRVAMRKNGVLTYLHADHLGSTVLETNASGAVTSDEKYRAYGKQRDSGNVSTDHRFTGQKEDASGLQYFNARYFDPQTGMFVSPDTIVPQPGLASDYNRYLAFRGNPLKFVDPSGHDPCDNGSKNCDNKGLKNWIGKAHYVYIPGYGMFDLAHVDASKAKIVSVVEQIQGVLEGKKEYVELRQGVGLTKFDQSMIVAKYGVDKTLTPEQIEQVALGMLIHFETIVESNQRLTSVFSVEDLPSDYIGWYTGLNPGTSELTILTQLNNGSEGEIVGVVEAQIYKYDMGHNFKPLPMPEPGVNVNWPPLLTMRSADLTSGLESVTENGAGDLE